MTRDEALTMIIASIAMEELALSHIVNAEGEKLQYILGVLPGGPKVCAGPEEVLAVNRSVTELLDAVMQNQMLLKGKLEKALEAGGRPPAKPPCPDGQSHPCTPPCGCGPCQKSAIHLVSRRSGFSWDNSFLLSWRCRGHMGCGVRLNEEDPALVELEAGKAYGLNYTINVRGPYRGENAGAVFVRLTPRDTFSEVLPLHFNVKCLACEPLTLHCSTTLFPQTNPAPPAGLSLLMDYKGCLFVEQATLNIFEM